MTPLYPKKPSQHKKAKKSRYLIRLIALLLIIAVLGTIFFDKKQTATNSSTPSTFDKRQHSVNDPSSIWAIVNKGRILPASYAPADLVIPNVPLRLPASDPEMLLRKPAAAALKQMTAAADKEGIHLMLSSGYRSYNEQVGLYKGYVASQGLQSADASSARPGHSEHQLGLSADLEPTSRDCEVETCFADTIEGKWLAANDYKYGFIIRYQKEQESLTGYEYEPWHVRYVGTDLAAQIQKSGQTLEQFFNLPAYSDYPANSYQLAAGK